MSELHQAAAAGDYEKVEELLKQMTCSPNEKDDEWSNKTPLHWAAAIGYTKMVKLLIDNGARPCLRTTHGWTAAHYAAEAGHLEVLQLLHSLHAPMDKKDSSGDRPLRLAEIYGHQRCIQFLKKAVIQGQEYRLGAAKKGVFLDDIDYDWDGSDSEDERDWDKDAETAVNPNSNKDTDAADDTTTDTQAVNEDKDVATETGTTSNTDANTAAENNCD
ncbi:ankyrin repeat domain-containing protein 66-like [Cynoglossus semilaevis]|uniref:ankyrin repeat domain-containing protein 66-like n=1 Tax=Cynoglossus semilaevis TaxID=244447 RepID=UPI0004962643|nr:ankyrin repeat domain-containing protein 66-like [Cynoglossus semilaevis]